MTETNCGHEREHELAVERAKENVLVGADIEKMCGIFRMLGEASRLKIVLALLEGDMCVYHLTEVCGGTFSGVSHQLRVLRDNKIVRTRRFGKNIEYSIADEHVREMVELAKAHLSCAVEE